VQEGYKLTIVLIDNAGFKSIGTLSRSLGQGGFGTRAVFPGADGLAGDDEAAETLPVNLAENARSLGAQVLECATYAEFAAAIETARGIERTVVIVVRADRLAGLPDYDSWWDVPVAEVSESESVAEARAHWATSRARERFFF
jgi:3D-(3,5/4)-trihydroxycyclohexane-1,2-dione acylhydrolase (decyclizing)